MSFRGNLQVDDITVQDMQHVLEPIWMVKTETASRLRGRIEAILAWASVSGHRSGENPARWRGNLDAVLPKPSKVTKVTHHPALSLSDDHSRLLAADKALTQFKALREDIAEPITK